MFIRIKFLIYKQKELLNLAGLVSLGIEPQIRSHIQAALNVGCSAEAN